MRWLFSVPLVTLPPVIDGHVVHSFVSTEDDRNPACPHTSATNNARKPESQRKIKEVTCTEETSGPDDADVGDAPSPRCRIRTAIRAE